MQTPFYSISPANQAPTTDEFYVFFTHEKRNLNRIRLKPLERFFNLIGLDAPLAQKIISYRNIHGEIAGFTELYGIGLDDQQIECLKSYFYIESSRKDVSEIVQGLGDDNLLENYDYYGDFVIHPLNLNSASEKDMAALPGINRDKAKKITLYRETKPIVELFELTNSGLSEQELLNLSPFITIRPPEERGLTLRINLTMDAESNNVLSNTGCPGSTSDSSFAYRFLAESRYVRFYYGTMTVTNPLPFATWESALPNSRYNGELDLPSFQVIGGHYGLQFGQNLLFGKSFTPPVTDLGHAPFKKPDKGAAPYFSLNGDPDSDGERDYFQGVAATFRPEYLEIFSFEPHPRMVAFYSGFDADTNRRMTNQTDCGGNLAVEIPLLGTSLGFTATRQKREDGKIDGYGQSFYYDSFPFENLNLYGEAASFGGMSYVQGLIIEDRDFNTAALGYYAESNFAAPNGSEALRGSKDCAGILAGAGYDFHWVKVQIYGDWSGKSTNSFWEQRYAASVDSGLPVDSGLLTAIDLEADTRLTRDSDGNNLRSFLGCSFHLWEKLVSLTFRYRNILLLEGCERGDMETVRLAFRPARWFKAVFLWNHYQAGSYNSALFAVKEPLYPGDFRLQNYYGLGNEVAVYLVISLIEDLEGGFAYSQDSRIIACAGKFSRDISVLLQMNL